MDCSICIEEFDSGARLPKVVPCGHSVCLKCLQQLTDKKCPTCRQAFQGPPEKFPTNFTVLQLLPDLKLRSDKPRPRGWCFKCGAAASPKCWAEHDVLAVGAALKRRLEGVLPRAARQLQGLQDQVQEEQAAQALTLLGGQSWGLTLRGGSRVFSGTFGAIKDPVTQAVLLGVAAKAGLTEATSSEGKYEVHWDWDRTDSAKAKDQADNVELVRGVERLINVDCSPNAVLEVLQAAAPTVEHLSLSTATAAALRETCAMPRLKRLQVIRCSLDFAHDVDPLPPLPGGDAVPLPQLPSGQARLRWLQVLAPRRALLELLLPAHRLTLEVLQLDSYSDSNYKMTCSKLSAVLKLCDLRALRRLVLINMLPNMYNTYKEHLQVKDHCSRQRSVLLRVLPAGAEVLCSLCDGDERAPLKEVF